MLYEFTEEEFNVAHKNIMTVMENHVMKITRCDRHTANLVSNEVLDLDREADRLLEESAKESIVNTVEINKELDRLIDLAFDKGRVAGYTQAKTESLDVTEEERDMIKDALEYLHDADLCEFGNENIRVLENLMTKMNLTFTSQLEE